MQSSVSLQELSAIAKRLNFSAVNYSTGESFVCLVNSNIESIKHSIKSDPSIIVCLSEIATKIDQIDPRCINGSTLKNTTETVHNLFISYCMNIPEIRNNIFSQFPVGNMLCGPIISSNAVSRLVCKNLETQNQFENLKSQMKTQEDYFSNNEVKTTVDEAIELIIDKKWQVANLTNFPEVTDSQLERLFESNCCVEHLILSKANHVTRLPGPCKYLQTLVCTECPNLVDLPERMENVTRLVLNRCNKINKLPERMGELHSLDCAFSNIREIPRGSTRLKKIFAPGNLFSELPSDAVDLQALNCSRNPNLKCIPERFIHLKELDCYACPELVEIPATFNELVALDMSDNLKIHFVPTLANLKHLYLSDCTEMKQLPFGLTKVEDLYINGTAIEYLPNDMYSLKNVNGQPFGVRGC